MSSDMEGRMQDQIEGAICENELLRRELGKFRWISVDERAPPSDDETPILAFNGRVQECWYFEHAAYDSRHGGAADCDPSFQDSDYNRILGVTHWMRMPEGPKP
jgi:hypothetical protein